MRIVERDGRAAREVLKLYRAKAESREGRHLLRFVAGVEALKDSEPLAQICAPFAAVVEPKTGRIGCLMREAGGSALDVDLYNALHDHPESLLARLWIAYRTASTIAQLHRHGIVHADLTEQNLFVDIARLEVFLIDLDGGGIMDSRVDETFRPELEPLVLGKQEGSFMAPELIDSTSRKPSTNSDAWSLAVLVHHILMAGLDPFFFASTYREVIQGARKWSPPEVSNGADPWTEFQRVEIARLGPDIARQLSRAFSPGHGGTWAYASRPSASDWSRLLRDAIDWACACVGCGEQIVTLRQPACPFCTHTIDHAMAYLKRGRVMLDSSSRVLLGRDLGLDDGGGRYEAITFARGKRELVLEPQVVVRDEATKRDIGPGAGSFRLGPGNHEFKAWSADPDDWRYTKFTVLVPPGAIGGNGR
jgi:serine/threonine protein kinase